MANAWDGPIVNTKNNPEAVADDNHYIYKVWYIFKSNKFKYSIDISRFNMFNSDVSRLRIILEEWNKIYVKEKEALGNRAIAPNQSNWMLINDALTEFNNTNLLDHLATPKEPKTQLDWCNWKKIHTKWTMLHWTFSSRKQHI